MLFGTAGLGAMPLGSTSTNPGVSAQDILVSGGSTGDGFYWIDPDGPDSGPAFQAYADMTTDGGGWTLGLNSVWGSATPWTDVDANRGTADLNVGHTRDMTVLGIDNEAQIRHRIVNFDGSVKFDGYYTAKYHDALGSVGDWTVFAGSLSAARLDYHAGQNWTTATDDQDSLGGGNCGTFYSSTPWYYNACWTVHPGYADGASFTPYANGNVASYQIFFRESDTPVYSAVPEPGMLTLFGFALLCLGYARRTRKRAA